MSNHNHDDKPAWAYCNYCQDLCFQTIYQFMKHLRDEHCTKEGGSYVCRYGENNVCCTLPVEGVSDADYEKHVYKHHTSTTPFTGTSRKISTSSTGSDKQLFPNHKWVHSYAAQHLPAVLNDPHKGKQKDFFTKLWGDGFTELTSIPDPPYLPHITHQHFEYYLKRVAKKYRRHVKLSAVAPKPHTHADLLQTFPSLRIAKFADKNNFDINSVPKIFLQPNFDLSNPETFNAVFTAPLIKNASKPGGGTTTSISPILQEKLTHYLDMVEVQIAEQVAQKSDAFFHAMTSHDVLMEQLGHTVNVVKTLRQKIQRVDKGLVKNSFHILKNERCLRNYQQVWNKLKIMSSVTQTQSTIRLLLSSPDYVGALDSIHSIEELLKQELAGIHSFRHLSSQLSEILKVIDKLMCDEFERYASADLNRPILETEPEAYEAEKLTCTVMGMLRRGNYHTFLEIYQREIISAIKAAMKHTVIEIVADKDYSEDRSLDEQLKTLSVEEWITLLRNTTNVLIRLLQRVKKGYEIMVIAVDISAGKHSSQRDSMDLIIYESGEWQLPAADHEKVRQKLHELLVIVCKYSQDGCAQLLSSRCLKESLDENKLPNYSSWFAEHATLANLKELMSVINKASKEWELICPGSQSLKAAFNIQVSKFLQRFHKDMTKKLFLILDAEPWRKTDVPSSFQKLVEQIADKGTFNVCKEIMESEKKSVQSFLVIGKENFAVVGTVLMLVNIVADYCVHAEEIPLCAESLLRNLRELLNSFNSRCSKLILGGEAVSEKTGMKKITSTNFALLIRALQLLLWLVPHVRLHFKGLLGENTKDNLDEVITKIKEHSSDLNKKLHDIMKTLIMVELKTWDAKPPIPSVSFRTISSHLKKLHEAVFEILPQNQIYELFEGVHNGFKELFREKLQNMNIVNDGGPTHGHVTTELLFYLEDLKKLKALPPEKLEMSAMNNIWLKKDS